MDHFKVAIKGQSDEEGNTGPTVEKQHEEHRLADHIILAAPCALLVMIDFYWKTGHQQKISNHYVEQESAFVLPELEPEK